MVHLRSIDIGALLGFNLSFSPLAYACSHRKDIISCRSVLNFVTLRPHFTSPRGITTILVATCQHVRTVDLPLDLNPGVTCTVCRPIPSKPLYRLTCDSEHFPEITKF
ncbi:hypothetical protein EV401DRAFT_746870 [Pisolithus croceorrhizus]|nr:hypothetical protein EV401DRAFT_746870 [Pisolithus croceorrhizus]